MLCKKDNLSWNSPYWRKKILKKSQSPGICVRPTSWKWTWWKFQETMKPHPVRHVRLHVNFSPTILSLGPYTFTFECEANLDGLGLSDQRETLERKWSRALSLVCEVALRNTWIWTDYAQNLRGHCLGHISFYMYGVAPKIFLGQWREACFFIFSYWPATSPWHPGTCTLSSWRSWWRGKWWAPAFSFKEDEVSLRWQGHWALGGSGGGWW